MIWLIWLISIIINTTIVLIHMKQEKNEVTYASLFSFFVFGITVAPLFTIFVLIGGIMKLYNKILDADRMNKTIYKFK